MPKSATDNERTLGSRTIRSDDWHTSMTHLSVKNTLSYIFITNIDYCCDLHELPPNASQTHE